jgi:hypothetical protein
MAKNAIRCEAIITSIRSRADGSLGLSLSTPELSSTDKVAFLELQNLLVDLLIIPKDEKDAKLIEVRKEIDCKTPGQRLRAVLFILFREHQKTKNLKETFDVFYARYMEKLIEYCKAKIDQEK